jgi:hypothetical protein
MTDRELLRQALEALESLFSGQADPDRAKRCSDAIVAIRAHLDAPQGEPWADAERIADVPEVDEAIRNLLDDHTGDNATAMVRAILQAAQPPAAPTQPLTARFVVTEEMHVAACKVLLHAHGLDGLPQRMLDAMLAVAPKRPEPQSPTPSHDAAKAEAFDWLLANCIREDGNGWLRVVFDTARQREAHSPDFAKWVANDIAAAAGVEVDFCEPSTQPASQPLTDEQMRNLARELSPGECARLAADWFAVKKFARAIERAHGILK